MPPTFNVINGDCLEVMKAMPGNSIDTIITDPPYHLTAGKKGGTGEASVNLNSPAGRSRVTTGFMGKEWDGGDVAFRPDIWREALRVAKPGATLLAFGGTRTFHRLTVAIEDAGWIIRDVLSWLYGSGFPKSLDLSKAIDKEAGEERAFVGAKPTHYADSDCWGKPNQNVKSSNGYSGGLNPNAVDGCRPVTAPATEAAALWNGWGTGLKPAWEPIIMAMKPLAGTYAANAREWGVAGINIDGCRIGTEQMGGYEVAAGGMLQPSTQRKQGYRPKWDREDKPFMAKAAIGRWPANLLLDEDAAAALDVQSGERNSGGPSRNPDKYCRNSKHTPGWGNIGVSGDIKGYPDTGGASRFFYVAKASRSERNAGLEGVNNHPTVKPVQLLRYLARLTATPTGGVVLDPFFGSGTTGVACILEGRDIIGIDKEAEYCNNIAIPRLQHAVKEWERLQQRQAPQPPLLEALPYAD